MLPENKAVVAIYYVCGVCVQEGCVCVCEREGGGQGQRHRDETESTKTGELITKGRKLHQDKNFRVFSMIN